MDHLFREKPLISDYLNLLREPPDGDSFDGADDQSALTEKKSKSKGITKKVKGFVAGKKGKKDKKDKHREVEELKRFVDEKGAAPQKDSEEWKAFEEMLERSQSAAIVSQLKLTKLESDFDELEESLATVDPWANVGLPGEPVKAESERPERKETPQSGWVGFEDDFGAGQVASRAEEAGKLPMALTVSPVPSPLHDPVPPNNSRRESVEARGEDLLGLDNEQPAVQATSGLLGSGSEKADGGATLPALNADILSLSRNVADGVKSSECSSLALGVGEFDAKTSADAETSRAAIDMVDEFLGISGEELKRPTDPLEALLKNEPKAAEGETEPVKAGLGGDLLGIGGANVEQTVPDDDDPFGFGTKVEPVGNGEPMNLELFIAEEGDVVGGEAEKGEDGRAKTSEFDVPGTRKAATPSGDDFVFDPRAEDVVAPPDVKPAQDTKPPEPGARVRPRARPKPAAVPAAPNPFRIELVTHDTGPRTFGADETGASGDLSHPEGSTNPFASAVSSKNPFTSESTAAAGGASLIAFADDDRHDGDAVDVDVTAAEAVSGGFNPFATITDVDAPQSTTTAMPAGDESFDPFQTIHGDDAFEFELQKAGEDAKPEAVSPNRFNPFNKEPPLDEKFASFEPMAKTEEDGKKTSKKSSAASSVDEDEEEEEEEEEDQEPLPPFYEPSNREGYKVLIRQPTKKKLTQNRFWKQVYVKIVKINNVPIIKVYPNEECKEQIHELALQPSYNLCNMGLQQFDQFGKCHTVKLQYVFYRERVGVKAERITPTLGDLTRVRDLKGLKDLVHKPKTTMILDHAPQASELLKFGGLDYEEFRAFIRDLEDSLFHMETRRDKTLSYTKDEITADLVDEYYAEIDTDGRITYHKARVRLFCLAFLTGMPFVEIGVNDRRRRGKEVVGRHDIIPIKTEEWIRIEDPEFHFGVDRDEYAKTKLVKFKPLDACQYELMRFRVRPQQNKELPLQIRCQMSVIDRHVEIRADVMIPGYYSNSRRASQTPCEDIMIRFPIPEPWIYLFRVEKRFRYGSVKSHTRKPGKIKGFERLTMMAQGMMPPSLIEVSTGAAKYEHIFHSIIWRISRLPERNEGAYKTHLFSVKVDLGPHDIVPEELDKYCYVEYSMPNSTVSRAQVRSISVNPVEDENPDKWVHHLAKYEYKVAVEFSDKPPKPPVPEVTLPENCIAPIEVATTETVEEKPEEEDSDTSDSSDSD